MVADTPSLFARVIQEHLELKRKNAGLEQEMPLERYLNDDPFANHPLFKSEEQARVEDTMDGLTSIVDQPTSLDWPTSEDTLLDVSALDEVANGEREPTDESLWTRSRDFDWGD